MVLRTVRHGGWAVRAVAKGSSRGSSGSSKLRSDGSLDGQAGGWTMSAVAKDDQGRVGKQLKESYEPAYKKKIIISRKPKTESTYSFSRG
jgi:hypothetical protein